MSQSNTPAQQLYDLLVSHDFEPTTLDVNGKPAENPAESDIFSFDYKTPNKDYGTVVIVLDSDQELEVYFGDNMGRSMEIDDKGDWYDFLYLSRMFAKRNLLSFSLKNLSRLKFSMKTMAAVKESIFEGYYGTRKVSYDGDVKEARLMIRHNRELGEGDQRYHHIDSLFIETAEGERFKLPFTNLTCGRAMREHVRAGGTPYDTFGQHISSMVSEMNTLRSFIRAARNKEYNGDAGHMVESAIRHYNALKAKAKRMVTQRGYRLEKECYDPTAITELDETVETVRELFVQRSLDPRIESALPILAKLQEPLMKEANEFESWASQVTEGTWSLPETPEQQAKLQKLMSGELIVGADATNATEQLYDVIGDDILFDRLQELADENPDANIWDDAQVIARLNELGIEIPQQPEVNEGDNLSTFESHRDWDEGNTEPPNNFAVYINGKQWKVFKGRGRYADDQAEKAHYRQLQDLCRKKTKTTGKKWTVSMTGAAPTNETIKVDEVSRIRSLAFNK